MAGENLHVAMLPWSAFGHLMPFFQLSIAIAKSKVHISFISTPKNIERLPQIPPDFKPSIDFISIPLPDLGLLPAGAEATVDIPFEKIQNLKSAYDDLRFAVEEFVSNRSPDFLIVDVIPWWIAEIARKFHVRLILFSAFSASALTFLGPPEYLSGEGRRKFRPSPESLMDSPEWITFDSSVSLKKYEAIAAFDSLYGFNGTDVSDSDRFAKILSVCEAVAVRSCDEFENHHLNLLRNILGKPVIPTGLLPPEPTRKPTEISSGEIFEFLEKQKPKSVVYVGFGSECKLTKHQIHEIAYGLELSELPFFWTLRKPDWAANAIEALPQGFKQRIKNRGMVTIGWISQIEILQNPAIGGSLFHGGWGSTIEMLQFGHCLVVLPLILDQPLNARFLVEKCVAVEIERDEEDGSFRREDIRKALRKAMADEEGEEIRANAREAGRVFGDRKIHDDYIDGFVEFLKNGRNGNLGKIVN